MRHVHVSIVVLAAIAPTVARAQGTTVSTTLRLTGYLQPRFQAVGDSASFFLRRARFAVEGNITPWASYRAQVEMRTIGAPATPPASPLTLSATDLWVRMSHQRWTGTVGQFRVPFSLESLVSARGVHPREKPQNRRPQHGLVRARHIPRHTAAPPAHRARAAVRPQQPGHHGPLHRLPARRPVLHPRRRLQAAG